MKTICIICPIGCELTVKEENGEIKVSGNLCPRGEEYGKTEYLNPKRVLITVIPCKNGELPVVSVKSSEPIDKELIPKVMKFLSEIVVDAAVDVGDVVIENLLGMGINIIATRKNYNIMLEEVQHIDI